MDLAGALTYAQKYELHALVVQSGDSIALEHYENGHAREALHALYSGRKSIWGIDAPEAEPVVAVEPEQAAPAKLAEKSAPPARVTTVVRDRRRSASVH